MIGLLALPPQPLPDEPAPYEPFLQDDESDRGGLREPTTSLSDDVEIRAIDWDGKLNRGHVKTLFQANVRTLADAQQKGKAGLMGITGIGEKIADVLLAKAAEYDL